MKMKSIIIKKSSLIFCISINLLILINIVQSNSSIKDLRYNDSGQCELNGLIVEPGERQNHPDECIQVVCFRDGSGRGKVNYCPWDPTAVYLDTTLPYPKCCKVKQSKSYQQFRTYYKEPSRESPRVNKQLQNQIENSEQESTRNNDYDVEKPVRKPTVFKTTAKPQLISRPTLSSVDLDENKLVNEKTVKPYTSIQRTRRPAFTRPSKPSVDETEEEEELNENEPEIQHFSASTRVPTTLRRRTPVKRIEISTTEKVPPEVTEAEDDSEEEEIPAEIATTTTTTTTTTTPAPITTTTTEEAKVETTTEKSEEKPEGEINNDDDNKEKEDDNLKVPLRRINLRKPISETTETAVKNEDEEQKEEEEKVEIKDSADSKEEEEQNVKLSSRPNNFRRPRPTPTEAVQVTTEDSKNDEQKVEINDDAENKEEVNQNVKPTFRPINFKRTRPTPTETVTVTTEDSKNDEEKIEINDDAENKEEVNQNVKPTLRPIKFKRPSRPTTTETVAVTTENSKNEEQKAEINDDTENKEEVNQNVKPTLRPIKFKRPSRPTTTETADIQITTELNDIAENKDEEEETVKTTLKPISARRPRPFQRNINTIRGNTPASVETEESASTPSSIGRPRPSRAQVSRNIKAKITTGGNEIDNDENYPSWYKNKNPTPPTLTLTEESTENSSTEGPVVEIGGKTDRKIPLRFRLKTTEEAEEEPSTETNVFQYRETFLSEKNSKSVSEEPQLNKELTDEENATGLTNAENESEHQVLPETSLAEKRETEVSEDISSQDGLSTGEQQNETTAFNSDEKLEFITSTESVVSIENETEREEASINSDENTQLKLDSESKSAESSSDKINSNFHSRDIFIHVKVVTEPNHINSTLSPSVNELESESIENANEKLSKREDTQKQIQINVFQKSNDESGLNIEQQKDIPVFNNAEIKDITQKIISHTIEEYNDSQQKVLDSFFDLKDLSNIIEKDSSISEGHRLSKIKESENLNKDLSSVTTQTHSQTNVAFNNENTQQKIDESISGLTASTNHFNSEQSTLNQATVIDGLNQKSQTNKNSNQLLQGSESFSENNSQMKNTEQDINNVQHSVGVIESQQHLINSDSDSAIHSKTDNLKKDNESSKQHTTHHQSSENKHLTTESIDVNNNSEHNERQQKLLETDHVQEAENSRQKLSTSAELENKSVEGSSIIENSSNQDSIETQQHLLNVDAELKEVLKESSVEGNGSSQQQNTGSLTVLTSSDLTKEQSDYNQDVANKNQQHLEAGTELKDSLKETATKVENEAGSLQQQITVDSSATANTNQEKDESEKTLREGSSTHFSSNQQTIEGSLQQTTANLKDSSAFDSTHTQTSNTEKTLTEGSSVEINNSQESIENQQRLLGADAELRDLQNKLSTQTEQSDKEPESSQQQIAVNSNDLTSSDSLQTQSNKNQKESTETKNVLAEDSSIQVNHSQEIIEGSRQQSSADLKVLGAIDSTLTHSNTEKALTEGSSVEINNSQESIESQQRLLGANAELRDLQNNLSIQTEQSDKETESSQQQIAVNSNDSTSFDFLQTQSNKNQKESTETKNVLAEDSSIQVNHNQEIIEGSQQQSSADLKVLGAINSTLTQTSNTEKALTEGSSVELNHSQESIENQQRLLGADAELRDLQNKLSTQTEQSHKEIESLQQQIAVNLNDSTSSDSLQTQSGKNEKELTESSSAAASNNQGFIKEQQSATHGFSQTSETEKVSTGASSIHINNSGEDIETQQHLLGADAELKDLLNEIGSKTDNKVRKSENSQHQIAVDLKDSTSTDSIETNSGQNEKVLTEGSFVQVNNNQGVVEQQQTAGHDSSHTSNTENGLTGTSSVQVNNNEDSIETQQQLLGAELKDVLNQIRSKTEEKFKKIEDLHPQNAVDLKDSTSTHSIQQIRYKTAESFKKIEDLQRQNAVDLKHSTSTHSIQTHSGKNQEVFTEGSSNQVNKNQEFIEQQQSAAHGSSHTSETGNGLTEASSAQINNNAESIETQHKLLGSDAESSLKTENNIKENENSQHQIAVDLKESTSSDSIQTQNNKNEKLLTEGASIQVNNNQASVEGLQQHTEAHDLSHTRTSETGKGFTEGSSVQVNNNHESIDTQQHLLGAEAELKDLLKEIGGKSSSESHSTQQQTIIHSNGLAQLNNNHESVDTQQHLLGADAELRDLLKEIGGKSSSESHSIQQQQQQITVHSNGLAQRNNNPKDIETQHRTLNEDAELRQLLLDLDTKRQELNKQQLETDDVDLKQFLQEIQTDKTDEFQQRSLRNNKENGIEPIYFRAPGRYRIVPGELIPVQLYLD